MLRASALLTLLLATTACTTQLTNTTLSATKGVPSAGFVYALPAAEVGISGRVTLKSCGISSIFDAELPGAMVQPKFAVTAAAVVEMIPGDEHIVLDYRHLAAFSKTGKLDVAMHDNGMLKSVNAGAEDHGPEIAGNVIKAAATIAPFFIGGPAAGLAAIPALVGPKKANGFGMTESLMSAPKLQTIRYLACTQRTITTLADRKAVDDTIEAKSGDLNTSTAAIDAINAVPEAKLKPEQIEQRAKLMGEQKTTAKAIKELAAKAERLDAYLSLSFRRSPTTVVADGAELVSATAANASGYFDRLFAIVEKPVLPATAVAFRTAWTDNLPVEGDHASRMLQRIESSAKITATYKRRTGPVAQEPVDDAKSGAAVGVVYLVSPRYRVILSQSAGETADVGGVTILQSLDFTAPQQGTKVILPLRSGFGEKVSLNATFAADGSLLTGTFDKPVSAGVAASAALAGAADSVAGALGKIEARRTSLLDDQVKQLTAQKSIAGLERDLAADGSALTAANADNALLTAEATRLETLIRIAQAKAKLETKP